MDELENLVDANNSESPAVRVQVLLYVTAEESIKLSDSEIVEESRGKDAEGLNTGINRKLAYAAKGKIFPELQSRMVVQTFMKYSISSGILRMKM
ncbi:hypothetical protein HK100_007399, partial [Physocladia obscura]